MAGAFIERLRRIPRWPVTLILTIGWYVALFVADEHVKMNYDVFDESVPSRMGSVPVDFSYGFAFALASVFPPLVAGLWRAGEQRVLRLCLVAMGSLVSVSTFTFYAGGAASCDELGFGPGQDEHFITLAAATLLVPIIAGAVGATRVSIHKLSLTLGLLVGATSSFLLFLLAGHCLPSSQKVIREAYPIFFLPYVLLLAIGCAALGAVIRRRLARPDARASVERRSAKSSPQAGIQG